MKWLSFVADHTDFNVVVRSGGDIELVKRLIAAGFPVLIEKGYYEADYTGKIAWMGHYLFVTGYDDASGNFIVQDAYLKPGKNMKSDYPTFIEGWRSFDYLFMVVYPPEREAEVFSLLGSWADPTWANQHALEIADEEKASLTGIDQFFAWFNKGTSHVNLTQYPEAAAAYDQAFQIYSTLGDDNTQRPYRMLWYQTGPYKAYFYSGRYQDTINLANTTLNDTISEPTLEESIYWRGMAYWALGQTADAIADFRETVRLNPHFTPGYDMLAQLGADSLMPTILHFADAHIDMANYGRHDPQTGLPIRVVDFLKSLDTIVDAAIDEKVDLVIFAGDAYKDRSPAPTFQREWGRRIMRLSHAGIPTLLLIGNHDLSPALGRAHALESFDTLEVPHCARPRPACFPEASRPIRPAPAGARIALDLPHRLPGTARSPCCRPGPGV